MALSLPAWCRDVSVREEVRGCLRLGLPLAAGELGWMSTYIVDALMIGRLSHSAAAIAASSLGNTIYYAIVFLAIYLLNGLETFVAQAVGRGDRVEGVRMLAQSAWIIAVATPAVMLTTLAAGSALEYTGVSHDLAMQTRTYLRILVWSTPALIVYMAIRRFLQSVNRVGLVSASLVTAGGVNLLFDWCLLYGHWGFPALGLAGSAWSTLVVRCWMLSVVVPGLFLTFRRTRVWPTLEMLRFDGIRLKALLRVGWPSGVEFSLELGISTFMSILGARLGTTLLAAHQVTLDLNAFAYMAPTGLAYAAMIRVGQAAGRNDLSGVKLAAHVSLFVTESFAILAAFSFLVFAHPPAALYTNDPQVALAATPLLRLCALLLVGDAAFVIIASAMTGLGDTRTLLWVSVVCDWLLGMPAAWLLAFPLGHGMLGLWTGRAIASVSSGTLLAILWRNRMRAEQHRSPALAVFPFGQLESSLRP